ncbi:MAG: GGDEF domain-containing protein [Phreatobacter sp.]|nr:GGDEF domain-containing protein [Phreatobacter sp.]
MEFLHPRTLLLSVVAISTTTGLLLLLSSRQNREERGLVYWGAANLLGAFGCMMLGLRDWAPDRVTIDLANAAILLGYALNFAGTRRFCHQKLNFAWVLAPSVVWLALCQWPAFNDSVEWRLIFVSAVVVATSLGTAVTLLGLKGEYLVSRYPAIGWHLFHVAVYLVRMVPPLTSTVPASNEITASPLITIIMFEALIHITLISFLQLSLTKDRAEDRYRRAAETDVLTGQPNRRAFMQTAEKIVARQDCWPACMVLIDVDRFKTINDTVGHAGGDAVLVAVANAIRGHLRTDDTFGRLGGEEFGCLLPNTTLQAAMVVAEGLRARIAGLDIRAAGETVRVSVSIGVSSIAGGKPDLDHLIDRADACLYEAKRTGRNRVVAREDGLRLAG